MSDANINEAFQDIIIFQPCYQQVMWGGQRLAALDEKAPEGPLGERWDISDQERGVSVVQNGVLTGKSIIEITKEHTKEVLGVASSPDGFPIMIKLIDAEKRLSLQVHPDDDLAKELHVGTRGKTECWYFLDNGGQLIQGTKSGITRDDLANALNSDNESEALEACLNSFNVAKDDFYFMPARTVHALGAGCYLFEIQQSCDCTFRVSDWGRLGLDGKPRPTHKEESLATIDFSATGFGAVEASPEQKQDGIEKTILTDCEYFNVIRYENSAELKQESNGQAQIIMSLDNAITITTPSAQHIIQPLSTVLVPAACAWYNTSGVDGSMSRFLQSEVKISE